MQSTGMRTRAAAGLLGVAVAAGVTGHLLGGPAAAKPIAPPAPMLSVPLQQELAAPPAHGTNILWLYIHGRWRAVPA